MAFRFWRRVKIAPGVTLNLSKSGPSFSVGPRGAKFTVGPRGGRVTAGIPGTGLFYTTTVPGRSGRRGTTSKSRAARTSAPAQPPQEKDRLTLSFFQRLLTPNEEEALVDGLRELVRENQDGALEYFRKAAHLPDGALLAGFLALKKNLLDEAADYLNSARQNQAALGRLLEKYQVAANLSIQITPEVTAHVGADLRGVLLALVEVYQLQEHRQHALECLQHLLRMEPDDVVIKLSLAELLFDSKPEDRQMCQKIVQLCQGVDNDSPLHAALQLYKAKALRTLGLNDAARDTLSEALRRKAGRSDELLRALRYERALVYEALGQKARARAELERLYAEAPNYEDAAERLGLK